MDRTSGSNLKEIIENDNPTQTNSKNPPKSTFSNGNVKNVNYYLGQINFLKAENSKLKQKIDDINQQFALEKKKMQRTISSLEALNLKMRNCYFKNQIDSTKPRVQKTECIESTPPTENQTEAMKVNDKIENASAASNSLTNRTLRNTTNRSKPINGLSSNTQNNSLKPSSNKQTRETSIQTNIQKYNKIEFKRKVIKEASLSMQKSKKDRDPQIKQNTHNDNTSYEMTTNIQSESSVSNRKNYSSLNKFLPMKSNKNTLNTSLEMFSNSCKLKKKIYTRNRNCVSGFRNIFSNSRILESIADHTVEDFKSKFNLTDCVDNIEEEIEIASATNKGINSFKERGVLGFINNLINEMQYTQHNYKTEKKIKELYTYLSNDLDFLEDSEIALSEIQRNLGSDFFNMNDHDYNVRFKLLFKKNGEELKNESNFANYRQISNLEIAKNISDMNKEEDNEVDSDKEHFEMDRKLLEDEILNN